MWPEPANFSSMVGEFMSATIPKYCKTLAIGLSPFFLLSRRTFSCQVQ